MSTVKDIVSSFRGDGTNDSCFLKIYEYGTNDIIYDGYLKNFDTDKNPYRDSKVYNYHWYENPFLRNEPPTLIIVTIWWKV